MSPLADQLNEASSFKARICIANQFFEAHRSGSLPLHHLASVAREIFGKQGCVRVSDLAAQTGLSLRQFERSFTQSIGLARRYTPASPDSKRLSDRGSVRRRSRGQP
jgi:hypothetical protein